MRITAAKIERLLSDINVDLGRIHIAERELQQASDKFRLDVNLLTSAILGLRLQAVEEVDNVVPLRDQAADFLERHGLSR